MEQDGVAQAIARIHPVVLVPGGRANLLHATQRALDKYARCAQPSPMFLDTSARHVRLHLF
jgi:hypothetical protein